MFKTGSTRTDSSDASSDVDENDRVRVQDRYIYRDDYSCSLSNCPSPPGDPPAIYPRSWKKAECMWKCPAMSATTRATPVSYRNAMRKNCLAIAVHAIETISDQSTHAIGSYGDRPRAHSDLQASSSLSSSPSGSTSSRYSPNTARRSVAQLGRTLRCAQFSPHGGDGIVFIVSARASSLRGHVTSGAQSAVSGAQSVAANAVSGTMSMAQEVVSHTKSAAGERLL